MPLRLLHTSDWHLGHQLHGLPRTDEHAAFLSWLLDTLEARAIDALIVAGDIFETANPPASAQQAWFWFLGRARRRMPDLDIVVIGGNHDSAARLDAPHPVLAALDIAVVGGLPRTEDGEADASRLVVPLRDAAGTVAAWVAAVPFLRPADLPRVADGGDPLVDGVRALYAQALALARERQQPGQALVAMGHCYMVGTALSELSERRVLGGNQHALPVDLFPTDLAYVALGHLHKAQRVGGREGVRYCGSPIPLSMSEADYLHQVLLVTLEGEALDAVEVVRVPRTVDLLRLPTGGPAPLADVLGALQALPARPDDAPPDALPFLEVSVQLEQARAGVRREVEAALADRAARLVLLRVTYTGDGGALADHHGGASLHELRPEDVFERRWRQQYSADPPLAVLASFSELVDAARQEEA